MLPVTAHRRLDYTMAFLELLLVGAGAARLLGEIIQLAAREEGWRTHIGWPIGLVIGGAALWAWFWRSTRKRLADDLEAEHIATPRRAYLFAVLGGGLVALVVGYDDLSGAAGGAWGV